MADFPSTLQRTTVSLVARGATEAGGMTFLVEAYLSESDRLLWRSGETDKEAAYGLAIKADEDPRIEVRILEVHRDDDSEVLVVFESQN